MHPQFDRRHTIEGHHVRFTSALDAETLRFENEFLVTSGAALNLIHRHTYLKLSRREFYLLQVRSPQGRPICQAATFIYRPSRLRRFGKAVVPRMAASLEKNDKSEIFKLKMLRKLCDELGDITQLRVQPERFGSHELETFSGFAARAGFAIAQPLFYTRTLKYDLKPAAELLPEMSAKLRSKLRPPKNGFQLRVLTEKRYIDSCRQALNESFSRTRGIANAFDFEAAFEAANIIPEQFRIIGMVHESNPDAVLAFSAATISGKSAEFVAAGSTADSNLRKIPFNYLIFWELIQWAQKHGASWIDMGGITSASADDPLAGISRFKRHFTENEIEICREFTIILRPLSSWFFDRALATRQLFSGQRLS